MTIRDATHAGGDADLAAVTGTAESPAPGPERGRPGVGRRAWALARNAWRQLTSMRTALILLFLLALASLPGALLPQWSLNASKTAEYIADNPAIGPWLDRLGFFEVFASPWYAAIYLLLFVSLIGCLLPRTVEFVHHLRMPPVATPRNLGRLPHHELIDAAGTPDEVAARITAGLRGWRVVRRTEPSGAGQPAAETISAEKGYLREVGNLVFHLSLVGLLVAIAIGKLVGYEGSVIITAPAQFCSTTPAAYDNFRPGLLVDGTDLDPFCVDVQSFSARYTAAGQAIDFQAPVRYQTGSDIGTDSWESYDLRVNEPLRLAGERLYLLGHGYTPTFRIAYPTGEVRDYAQPFAPEPNDPFFTSQGAIKVTDPPGATPEDIRSKQLAIVGIFAPTAVLHGGIMTSAYPAADDPGVAVDVYRGDLGMENGRSQSVFAIDMGQVDKGALVKQARSNLAVGESITLDDGTAITFTGYQEWVSVQTSYDPAQLAALFSAIFLLCGLMLSLLIKRRRVWYRIRPVPARAPAGSAPAGGTGETAPSGGSGPDRTVVEVGGLARTDRSGYGEEFARLASLARPEQTGTGHR